jgi:hypothetical protein
MNLQKPYTLPLAEGAFPDTIKKQTEQSGDVPAPVDVRGSKISQR